MMGLANEYYLAGEISGSIRFANEAGGRKGGLERGGNGGGVGVGVRFKEAPPSRFFSKFF